MQIKLSTSPSHMYTDTRPTSPSADPKTPGAWQGSHWNAIFLSHWYDSTRTNPGAKGTSFHRSWCDNDRTKTLWESWGLIPSLPFWKQTSDCYTREALEVSLFATRSPSQDVSNNLGDPMPCLPFWKQKSDCYTREALEVSLSATRSPSQDSSNNRSDPMLPAPP